MDLLYELYNHPAYVREDNELLKKKIKLNEVIHELEELIFREKPTVKVNNVLKEEHYKECWESKIASRSYDQCGIRCLCNSIDHLHEKGMLLLSDIEKLSVKKNWFKSCF